MTFLDEALFQASNLFLDRAPVIYFVERKEPFFNQVEPFFARVDVGQLVAVTSPLTLAESLFYPYKQSNHALVTAFRQRLVTGQHVKFIPTNSAIAERAAWFCAYHNLSLADGLQVATAVHAGCDAFLASDKQLQRIKEIRVIVLSDLIAA